MQKFNSVTESKKLGFDAKSDRKNYQYKLAFVFALVLHLALFIFLFVRFALPHSYATSLTNANIIQAVAVTPQQLSQPVPQLPKVVPPEETKQLQNVPDLKQELELKAHEEQLAEMKALKIKKQKILKKNLMQTLQKELAKEAKNMSKIKQRNLLRATFEKELAQEKQSLAAQMGQQQSQIASAELDKYKAMLLQAIAANWIVPDGIDKNATCLLLVNIAPGGDVTAVKLLQSSGNQILDRSAQTAVLKSSPLPVPKEPDLFDSFRTIRLTVRPEGFYNS